MSYYTNSLPLLRICAAGVLAAAICAAQPTQSHDARDPGVRPGDAGAGGSLPGILPNSPELAAFGSGRTAFLEVDDVPHGLGPRFNLDSCAGCHAFPAVGGSSPAAKPQMTVAVPGRN